MIPSPRMSMGDFLSLHRNRSLSEICLGKDSVDDIRRSFSRGSFAVENRPLKILQILDTHTFSAKSLADLLIIAQGEIDSAIALQNLDLVAGNLPPAAIGADDGYHRKFVADERVILHQTVGGAAVAVDDPNIVIG